MFLTLYVPFMFPPAHSRSAAKQRRGSEARQGLSGFGTTLPAARQFLLCPALSKRFFPCYLFSNRPRKVSIRGICGVHRIAGTSLSELIFLVKYNGNNTAEEVTYFPAAFLANASSSSWFSTNPSSFASRSAARILRYFGPGGMPMSFRSSPVKVTFTLRRCIR
jgi:hypothetical protein